MFLSPEQNSLPYFASQMPFQLLSCMRFQANCLCSILSARKRNTFIKFFTILFVLTISHLHKSICKGYFVGKWIFILFPTLPIHLTKNVLFSSSYNVCILKGKMQVFSSLYVPSQTYFSFLLSAVFLNLQILESHM